MNKYLKVKYQTIIAMAPKSKNNFSLFLSTYQK